MAQRSRLTVHFGRKRPFWPETSGLAGGPGYPGAEGGDERSKRSGAKWQGRRLSTERNGAKRSGAESTAAIPAILRSVAIGVSHLMERLGYPGPEAKPDVEGQNGRWRTKWTVSRRSGDKTQGFLVIPILVGNVHSGSFFLEGGVNFSILGNDKENTERKLRGILRYLSMS